MNTPDFVYPLIIDGELGCFHFWAVVNNAVMTVDTQISPRDLTFTSFGCTPMELEFEHRSF